VFAAVYQEPLRVNPCISAMLPKATFMIPAGPDLIGGGGNKHFAQMSTITRSFSNKLPKGYGRAPFIPKQVEKKKKKKGFLRGTSGCRLTVSKLLPAFFGCFSS